MKCNQKKKQFLTNIRIKVFYSEIVSENLKMTNTLPNRIIWEQKPNVEPTRDGISLARQNAIQGDE